MRILVTRPQIPFAWGGTEVMTDRLVDELRVRGHEAELVTLPFKWYPGTRVLTQAFLWRMLDLDEVDGAPVDMVVATKFPSYL
ncbi:MAG: glycosyltransferase family 1 protein, partial [Actinobacteria bacterium]|nr:glycosyltransferase family 1 protein [Actinomycetota bacterium]